MSELMTIEELKAIARKRDLAQAELKRLLSENSQIADDIRDIWKHQRSLAE